ncbi:MAG TPA: SGNH/GDSL hydrolase family protein [Chloroflexota bacterium]|jgi:lysophospholipase L1-like esterase
MRKLAVLLSALALFVSSAIPAAATSEGHDYLALGDSVSFGTNPLVDPASAANFIGYPETVAHALNVEDVNASCPGEATGGFISSTGLDNVCRPYRASFPLHVSYSGAQLAFAVNFLKNNPRTRLVTITLGANDAFRLGKGPGPDVWPPSTCFTPNVQDYFATCAVQNFGTIFTALRGTGYNGLIVALTYYALDYNDPASLGGATLLNNAMKAAASHHNVLIASGFDAWKATALAAGGDTCAAGLRIALPTGGCDIHPSAKGRDLLAQAVVNTIAASCPGSVKGCLNRR